MPTQYAKLSTSTVVPFGPVLDSTGAEYTGLVVAEVKISKNNGTPAALNGSATLVHKEVGIYELTLTTSDISAVGQATLTCSKTTYVAPPVTLIVLPAKVYDSIVGGTDNLEVDAIQWAGVAVTGMPMPTYTQPTGFLTTTFPSGTVASTTNITAGTITTVTTVTTLTNLPAITAGWLTAIGIADDAITEAKIADGTINAATFASGAISAGVFAPGAITFLAIQDGAILASKFAAGAINAAALATDAVAEIADGVWDEVLSGHLTAGTTGAALNGAGSAGDPWGTALPGAYGAGTAGKIVGDNLDATVGSRSTQTSVNTIDDFLDTEIAAILAKTNLIPSNPASVSDIPTVNEIWQTALTEAYRATGATGTAAELLYELLENLINFRIVGTEKIVTKLDGSTTAKEYLLDSSTVPTAIEESL